MYPEWRRILKQRHPENFCAIEYLKHFPKGVIICRDLQMLDKLIAAGAKPSQIRLASEIKDPFEITTISYDEFAGVAEMAEPAGPP